MEHHEGLDIFLSLWLGHLTLSLRNPALWEKRHYAESLLFTFQRRTLHELVQMSQHLVQNVSLSIWLQCV